MRSAVRVALGALFVLVIQAAANPSVAQSWPVRPVRMVIPFTPGAQADLLARTVAQKQSEIWGQSVVVENRPGGGATIGTLAGARATPDGYTMTLTSMGPLILYPALSSKPPYNAVTDFEPIVPLVSTSWVLFTHPDIPAKTVAEFVAYAKANPGKLNGATTGIGTTNHLSNVMLGMYAGINVVDVHYNGSAGAIADLMVGRTHFMFDENK